MRKFLLTLVAILTWVATIVPAAQALPVSVRDIAAASERVAQKAPAAPKKGPTESEYIYSYYLKEPTKLGLKLDEDSLRRVMAEIKAHFVEEVKTETLLAGIVPEVRAYLKVANVSSTALSTLTVDNDLPQHIASLYGAKVNKDLLWYAMIRGVLSGLKDPYTVLMLPQEYQSLKEQMQAETFGGIGIYIELDHENKNQLTVVEPIEDTPAWRAGLQPGDQIVKINGKPTQGVDIDVATNRIRGPVGSQVVLTVHRKSVAMLKDYSITRAQIKVTSVTSKMLENGMGYARMRVFGADTASELQSALDKLKSQGAKGLILDLRNNGGGYITAAVDICSLFLPEGDLVVYTVDRNNNREDMRAKGPGAYRMPMVLLVNNFSASASEITAGCLKDHKVATLVGQKTFGKGSVQQLFQFTENSALKITIEHFFSPLGNKINHVGILPDVTLKMEAKNVGRDNDTQLQKAITVLQEKMAAAPAATAPSTSAAPAK